MSRILTFSVVVFVATLLALPLWGQSQPETSAAPIPAQIAAAKKIFISNLGEESFYYDNRNWYSGGPNRAYNQFYSAMKNWGQYDLVSTPSAADLVFEIIFQDGDRAASDPELRLRIVDPQTHVTLWGFTQRVDAGGLAKTREKNYDLAMAALVNDVKKVASPAVSQPAQK